MEEISAQELHERIGKGEKLHIIDVREPYEHEEGHIEGARNIPMAEVPQKLSELENQKADEIIIHCNSGDRSSTISKFLEMNGFNNIKHLSGGMDAYKKLKK